MRMRARMHLAHTQPPILIKSEPQLTMNGFATNMLRSILDVTSSSFTLTSAED